MKRKNKTMKLTLAKETLRDLVPNDLEKVAGGRISCGVSGCDCSGGTDTAGWCNTLIPK